MNGNSERQLSFGEKFQGPVYIVLATFMVTIMSTFMKLTWGNGSTYLNTLLWRNIGHFFINYIIVWNKPELKFNDLTKENWNLGILRGCLSAMTSTLNNLGVYYLSLGEAFAIRETRPLMNVFLNSLHGESVCLEFLVSRHKNLCASRRDTEMCAKMVFSV